MSRSTRRPRSPIASFGAAMVSVVLLGALPAVTSAASEASFNLLDYERVDVAVLAPGPDGAARLLVVDPVRPGDVVVRTSLLERAADRVWSVVAHLEVAAPIDAAVGGSPPASAQPWLVALGDDRFALLVASDARDETTLHPLSATGGVGAPTVAVGEPVTLAAVVDDAGVADVDADGRPELIVANARTAPEGGTCQSSRLWVLDAGLRVMRTIEVPERRLAAGVLGAFDDVAGDDLVAYAHPNCPANPDAFAEQRLVAVRLADGTIGADRQAATADAGPDWSAPPVRFDADGDGRHELLTRLVRGLLIVDPDRDWADIRVASDAAIPLGATIVTDPDGATAARVAWLEPSIDGRASVGTELVRRDAVGALDSGPATVMWQPNVGDRTRWTLAVVDAIAAASRQAGPVGTLDSLLGGDCAELIAPLVVVPCATSELLAGSAWVATRPVAVIDPDDGRRVITAAASNRTGGSGLPPSPTPWAGGADGRWRHGPSAPFSLAELAADDVLGGRSSVPWPSVDRDAAVGPVATLGGAQGLRLLVTVTAAAPDAPEPPSNPEVLVALGLEPPPTGRSAVIRLPVTPGAAPGAGRGSATIDLARATPADGSPAERWSVMTVVLDDRGEVGEAFATTVSLDVVAPALDLMVPDVTPIWPIAARLEGSVEPGAAVRDEGGNEVVVAADGSFSVERTLGPWPQAIRLVATDAFGNEAIEEVTVVGGVDYRAWAWPAILAGLVIVAVVVSGFAGTHARRADVVPRPTSRVASADDPVPELEELTPGHGSTVDR